MRATAIVRVLSSKTAKVKAGDIVCAPIGWTEVAIVPEAQIDKFEVPKGSDVTERLCALGELSLRYNRFPEFKGLQKENIVC